MSLKSEMYSNEELADVVENEGLGYAIQSYVSADWISDRRLREKWERAKELLDEIEEDLEQEDD